MKYNTEATVYFARQLKRLATKYPPLKSEMARLIEMLAENPEQGTPIGKDCYKIRLSVASKGKGKSGGARIITHVYVMRKTVYLLSVYDKSEQDNIPPALLEALLMEL